MLSTVLFTAVVCGFAVTGAVMLVLLVGLVLRVVPVFDAPIPFEMWSASWGAQAQIAAAWILASVALTAIGWLLVAIYLPVATGASRYDLAVLWDPAAAIPGMGGLILGVVAHARLTILSIGLGARCGLTAAENHLVKTFETNHAKAADMCGERQLDEDLEMSRTRES